MWISESDLATDIIVGASLKEFGIELSQFCSRYSETSPYDDSHLENPTPDLLAADPTPDLLRSHSPAAPSLSPSQSVLSLKQQQQQQQQQLQQQLQQQQQHHLQHRHSQQLQQGEHSLQQQQLQQALDLQQELLQQQILHRQRQQQQQQQQQQQLQQQQTGLTHNQVASASASPAPNVPSSSPFLTPPPNLSPVGAAAVSQYGLHQLQQQDQPQPHTLLQSSLPSISIPIKEEPQLQLQQLAQLHQDQHQQQQHQSQHFHSNQRQQQQQQHLFQQHQLQQQNHVGIDDGVLVSPPQSHPKFLLSNPLTVGHVETMRTGPGGGGGRVRDSGGSVISSVSRRGWKRHREEDVDLEDKGEMEPDHSSLDAAQDGKNEENEAEAAGQGQDDLHDGSGEKGGPAFKLDASHKCDVCGEQASGHYFGALVCLPCKSFFIRCTKDGRPTFSSQCGGKCDVLKGGRVRCQHCRFQRCISAGMNRKEKPEAVEPAEGQLLCKVCGDIANGIHFGVTTCEGCKKFFRRGLKENRSYTCKGSMHCSINPRMRNNCRYCRYQKCLLEGMSREAIKMGRPKKGEMSYSKAPIKKNGMKTAHTRNLSSTDSKAGVVSSSSMNLMNTTSSLSNDFEQDEVSSTDAGNGSVLFDHHQHQHQDPHQHEHVLQQQQQQNQQHSQSGGFSLGSILHDCMTVQDWDNAKIEIGQAAPSASSANIMAPSATSSSSTILTRSIPEGSGLAEFGLQQQKQRQRQAFQMQQQQQFQEHQNQNNASEQDARQKHIHLIDHFPESVQSYQEQQLLDFPDNDCGPGSVPVNRAVKVEDDRLEGGPEGTFSQNVVLETMQNLNVIGNSAENSGQDKSTTFLPLQQQSRQQHELHNQEAYDIQPFKPISTYLLSSGNVGSGDALNIIESGGFSERDVKYTYSKDISVSETVDAASSLGASVAAKLGGQVLAINMSGRSVTYVPQNQETIFLPSVDEGSGELMGENGVHILHGPGEVLLPAPPASVLTNSEGGVINQGQIVYTDAELSNAASCSPAAPQEVLPASVLHGHQNGVVKSLTTAVSSYPPSSFNNLLTVSSHHHQQQQILQQQEQQHVMVDSRNSAIIGDAKSSGSLLGHDLDEAEQERNAFRNLQGHVMNQHDFESPRPPSLSVSQLTPSLLSQPSIIKHILTNVTTPTSVDPNSSFLTSVSSRMPIRCKTPNSPRSVDSLLQQYREAVRSGKPVQLFPDEIAALLSTITSEQTRLLQQQQQQQQQQEQNHIDEILPPQAQNLTVTSMYSPTPVARSCVTPGILPQTPPGLDSRRQQLLSTERPLSRNSPHQSQVQQQADAQQQLRRLNMSSPHTPLNRSSPFIARPSPSAASNTSSPSPRPASRNVQNQHLVVTQKASPIHDSVLPATVAGVFLKTNSPTLEVRLQQVSSPNFKNTSASHSPNEDFSNLGVREIGKNNSLEVVTNNTSYLMNRTNNNSNASPTDLGSRSLRNENTTVNSYSQHQQHHQQKQLGMTTASTTAEVIDDSFNSSLVRDSALLHEINRIFLGIDNSCEACACDRRSSQGYRKRNQGGVSTDSSSAESENELRAGERMDSTLSSMMSPDEFMPELSHNYWHGFTGSGEPLALSPERQQIIKDIMAAFDNLQRTFVLKEHDQVASPTSKKSNDLLEHWHLIQKRIARHVVAGQRFCRNIPGYFKIDIQDRISLGKHVGFGLMVLIACTEFYDPEFKRFRHIWNWVVQMQNPLFSYKVHLLQLGDRVHDLNVDSTEAAMLCAISMTSVDCPDLVKPSIVCLVRDSLIRSLEAYMAAKQAPQERLSQLLSIMPQVRLMTVWYNNLMKRMSLPSDIAASSRPGNSTNTRSSSISSVSNTSSSRSNTILATSTSTTVNSTASTLTVVRTSSQISKSK